MKIAIGKKYDGKYGEVLTPEEKRRVVRLRRDILCARRKWREEMERSSSKQLVLWKGENSSRDKKLYFVRVGEAEIEASFLHQFVAELQRLEDRVKAIGVVAGSDLWLPAVFIEPKEIQLTTYYSRSLAKVTKPEARSLAKKMKYETQLPEGAYYVVRPAVSDRVLKIRGTKKGPKDVRMNTSSWAVCVLADKEDFPILRRRTVHPKKLQRRKSMEGVVLGTICSSDGTTLYCAQPSKDDADF